jgi:hypothetical protein
MASRGDIQAGKAYVTTYVKNSALLKGLQSIKTSLQGLGTSIMKIGSTLTAAGSSILAPIGAAVTQFVAMGSELDKVSRKTGLSAASLAEFKYAAEQVGAGLGDVEAASKTITKTLADAAMGSGSAHVALSRLGLTAAQLKSQSPEDQLQTVADRLKAIKDPALQAAMATQLLGGTNLLPAVQQLGALRKEARDLNLVPTDKAVADAARLGRMTQTVFSAIRATVFEIGAAVAPMLFPIGDTLINIVSATTRWVRENAGLVRTVAMVAVGVVGIGLAVTAVGALIFGLGTAFGLVASAVTGVASIIGTLLSPLGLIVAAVAAGVVYWLRFTDAGRRTAIEFGQLFGDLRETLNTTIGGIGDALRAGDLQLAAQIAVKGIQLAFMQGVDAISKMIGGQLGATFGTIGNKIIKGDFLGAWQTALKQLSAWHAQFVEGITALWTMGAKAAVDAWKNAVNTISDMLLDASAGGGVVGKAVSMALGVDLQAEIARANQLNSQLGIEGPDALEEAKKVAREQTGAIADALTKRLDQFIRSAQDNTDAANQALGEDTADAANGLTDEIRKLQEELLALRNQAKVAAANAPRGFGGLAPNVPGQDVVNPTALRQGFGSFSGLALQLGGQMEGPAVVIAREQLRVQRETQENTRQMREEAINAARAKELLAELLGAAP